jgi:hypothetical protein
MRLRSEQGLLRKIIMKFIPRRVLGRRMVITSTGNDYKNDKSLSYRGLSGYIILGANPVEAVALDGSEAKFKDRVSDSYKDIGVLLGCIPHRDAKHVLGSASDVRGYLDSVFLESEYDMKDMKFYISPSAHDPSGVIWIYFGRVSTDKYGKHTLNCRGNHGFAMSVGDLNKLLSYPEMVESVIEFFTPYFVQEEEVNNLEYILDLHVDKFKGTKSELLKELRDLITTLSNSDGCLVTRGCISATLNTVKEPTKFQVDPEDRKPAPSYAVVVTKNRGWGGAERTYVLGPYGTRKAASKAARKEPRGRVLSMDTIVYRMKDGK